MIKTKLFLNYMNRNIFFKPFEKFLEKGLRGELGNILELRTGYTCNNNCINCSFKHKKHLIDRNTEECKKILKNNRYERNLLIISGGEPTIRKDIFDLIAYARDIDYQWIQFRSNGRMFYYRDFAEKIVQLIREHNISNEQRDINHEMGYNFRGLDIFEFVISLHGHTSELHDTITEVSKSFDQTIQGIKNLLDLNQIVVVNVIINKMNYKYLLNIGKYLSNLGVKYIEFSFITSDENLFPNFNDITPKISDFQLHLPKVIDELCRKEKLCNILINNIPFCFINKNKFYSSEYFFPYDRHHMYKLVDLDITSTYYENQIKNNIKGEKCKYCINDPICFGLNKKYAEKIGFEELNPILGNLRDLVEKDKIELFKNLKNLKPSDLRFEFDDQKFKLDFNNIKSDVIALLSGGVDSTMGISLYAKNNKDKKIVIITFDESHSPGANESLLSSNYLMKRHKNIIKH